MVDRITFKKEPRETGLRSVVNPTPATQIKFNGKVCGFIRRPHWSDGWIVCIAIPTEKSVSFRWVKFAKRHTTEPEARKWLLDNWQRVLERYGRPHVL